MKSKTKVLLIHNIIAPYRLPLFQELSNKCDLTVLFCRKNDKTRLWDISLSDYTFKFQIMNELGLFPLYTNYGILYHLMVNKFDVIILADPNEAAFSVITSLLFAKILKKPVIIWAGQTDREIYFFPKLKDSTKIFFKSTYTILKSFIHIYHKLVYKYTDCFIAYSIRTKAYLEKYGVNKNKIFVGTQIMPHKLLVKSNISKEFSEFKNKQVILYIGYLNKRKGVDILISAFQKINITDTILLIVGSGEERDTLRKLAKNDKNIHFIENVVADKRAYYYSIADIFVLPTTHDVWGFVTNEALYYDLPVIITNSAASSELIENGKTGFIIQKNNTLQLQNALTMFLNNSILQTQIRSYVKSYNKDKIVDVNQAVKTFIDAINYCIKKDYDKPGGLEGSETRMAD